MRLSVVVPTLNEGARIGAALRSLASMRAAGHEVIVVDGGSCDDTVCRAEPLADRVLHAPRGRASQMNVGATFAGGDVLLFLHADCRAPDDAAEAIACAIERGHRWGRFDVAIEGRSSLLPLVAASMNLRSRATGIATGDQGIFVTRPLFMQAGGFPRLPLMEDVELARTLRRIAGPPACLRTRIVASGRRWDEHGALPTIVTMWSLRLLHWLGVRADILARRYRTPTATPLPTLIVFAREPRLGRVKQRLAASVGAAEACAVHVELVERTLAIAREARDAGIVATVELWCDPDAESSAFRDWRDRYGVTLFTQIGFDLGARMRKALHRALARPAPAILVGTDCPVLDAGYLGRAAAALADHDAVFGPAEDGGYVLVGLSRAVDAFDGIAWGTTGVMAATRALLEAQRATWQELPLVFDVDVAADLARWRALSPRAATAEAT